MSNQNLDGVTSEIQKEILRKNLERESQSKRGVVENNNFDDSNEDTIYFNFLVGAPRIEIYGKSEKKYKVSFLNRETGSLLKEFDDVKTGEWVQADQEYFIPWVMRIESVGDNNEPDVKTYTIDLKNKNVFIAFESSALGDTIAWIPIVEEFRKKHECNIIVSTFHNEMFKDIYPEMKFVDRGSPLQGMHFQFRLGWFGSGHASNRNPYDCHTRNLQQIAMDILGIDMDVVGELRPQLKLSTSPRKIKPKYVVITTCSTAQFKYWNHAGGWQSIVDYLVNKGYQVVNVGKQPNVLHNVVNATGQLPTDDLFNVLQNAEFFIGLPSGLAWLNWALGKKTIMITGISDYFCEFQEEMYRVEKVAENVCHGCFNNPQYTFDKGLWLYCPIHINTARHFECTKTITPDMVKKKIALVEKHLKTNTKVMLDKSGNLTNKTNGEIICKLGE